MNPRDAQRLAVAVGALGEAYRTPITEATIRAYKMGLDDLPIAEIEKAVRRAFREKKFMPTVSELRELAGDISIADRAPIAWDAVELAMCRYGYTASVSFDDPAINATIRNLGGWERLPDRVEAEGKVWVRKQFEQVYQTYCRRGVTAAEGAHLPGYHERHNGFSGYIDDIPKPALIQTTLRPAAKIEGPRPQRPAVTAAAVTQLTNDIGRIPGGNGR